MLQQTRVDQVIPFYRRFLARFPSVRRLAVASPAEVLKAWYGLGYNRRAVHLHRAAQAMVGKPFPRSASQLRALPGLGPYAAAAVATFAFNAPEALLDTNAARVLHRVFVGPDVPRPKRSPRAMRALAETVLDRTDPRRWNEALFDLGASVCTKRAPRCSVCPLQRSCRATPQILRLVKIPPKRRSEPQYYGVPRRLWRGRVMRMLHSGSRPLGELCRRLGLPPVSIRWLRALLAVLCQEGLVGFRRGQYALPR